MDAACHLYPVDSAFSEPALHEGKAKLAEKLFDSGTSPASPASTAMPSSPWTPCPVALPRTMGADPWWSTPPRAASPRSPRPTRSPERGMSSTPPTPPRSHITCGGERSPRNVSPWRQPAARDHSPRALSPWRHLAVGPGDVTEEAIRLVSDVRALQDDADFWKGRCLESRRACSIAVASEEQANRELQIIQEREKQLEAHSLSLCQQCALAEHVATRSEARTQQSLQDLDLQQQVLSQEQDRCVSLRRHVSSLEDSLATASNVSSERAEQLRFAEERSEAVELRIAGLQERLQAAHAQHIVSCERAEQDSNSLHLVEERSDCLAKRLIKVEDEMACEGKKYAANVLRMQSEHVQAVRAMEKQLSLQEMRKASLEETLASERMNHEKEVQRLQEEHREAQWKLDKHSSLLAQRVAEVEDRLAVMTSRHATELERARSNLAGMLEEADKHSDAVESRAVGLERAFAGVTAREKELSVEAASLRATVEQLEEANSLLRSSWHHAFDWTIPAPCPPPWPSYTRTRPGSARFCRDQLRVTQELNRMPRPQQLLSEVLRARSPDRTIDTNRYNVQGRLVCYDASGRRVVDDLI